MSTFKHARHGPTVLSILPRTLKSIEALKAGTPAILAGYAKNEASDPRVLRTLQDERLRRLVAHAAEHVPFWKRRFARFGVRPTEVRSIKDIASLPPLEERDLVDFGDDLVTDGTPDARWFTTRALDVPERLVRVDGVARRERVADELRHVSWTGLDWRTPRAAVVGRGENGEVLEGTGGRIRAALRSGLWLHAGSSGEDDVRTFTADATRAKAELLTGTPSSLERVADACETGAAAGGAAPYRPRAVQSWGECLPLERRQHLETALGAQVYNAYRTRETGEAAHECAERDGLHVTMERVLIEFVRDGEPVADGEDGEMLVTVLDNVAMPLFRYRIGDIGVRVPTSSACACGRTSERIFITDGRTSSLVTSPSGKRIHPDWFEWMFEEIPGVLDWRITQDAPHALTLTFVKGQAWRDEAERWIFESLLGVDRAFRVTFVTVPTIAAPADGRRQRVVSRAPLSWNGV